MPVILKSLLDIGSNNFDIIIGADVCFKRFMLIINGSNEGSAELYHNNRPVEADFIVNSGNINIKRLKNTIKTVIMKVYIDFFMFI